MVEIDGGYHRENQDYDAVRDNYLKGLGLHVQRFSDKQVLNALPQILDSIVRLKTTQPFGNPKTLPRRYAPPLRAEGEKEQMPSVPFGTKGCPKGGVALLGVPEWRSSAFCLQRRGSTRPMKKGAKNAPLRYFQHLAV